MNPHDRVRLRHVVDALNAAMRFAQGRGRGDLDSDEMLLFALVRAIEIVGEAASKYRTRRAPRCRMFHGIQSPACGIDLFIRISTSIATSSGRR
jgi:hypothetical protein